jgi:hypothetical protein
METFLDIDKIECVTVEDAKAAYPQVDWGSDRVTRLTWDAPRNGEIVMMMALEDLKTLIS